MKLRVYQRRGLEQIRTELASGTRRVLAVAPTAAGKGTMASALLAEVAQDGKRGVFVVHRREIVLDIAQRLRKLVGPGNVGVILPGKPRNDNALIQVVSIQTLLCRELVPKASMVVIDEAHHYAADEWKAITESYRRSKLVGFTATPQRSDGRAMGDVFQKIVVIATYAELLKGGYIVPCKVLRPAKRLGIDLAQDPLDAYKRYANGRPAFVFVRRVDEARRLAKRFNRGGVPTGLVHAKTGRSERDETLAKLGDGRLLAVVNVYALTEGVDVPRVSAVVLARTCQHVSTFVQITGRVLRGHPGKKDALVLDLTGVSHKHGLPTDERIYSLEGTGMGTVVDARRDEVEREERTPKVLGVELATVEGSAAEPAAPDPKRLRWDELAAEIEAGRLTVAAGAKVYEREFGERSPWVALLSDEVKATEMRRLEGAHRRLAPLLYQETFK